MRNEQGSDAAMNMGEVGEASSRRQMPYNCWSQVTPQYMPWGHNPSHPPASLVTFTAQQTRALSQFTTLHCKRKGSHLDMPQPSAKQLVTEERMAAHMSRLHISSEEASPRTEESAATREQRLYVCEEMRRLQTESILPQALLGRVQRPCMAVMLWQPPPKIPDGLLPPPPRLPAHNNTSDNNNSSSVDLNNMEMEP